MDRLRWRLRTFLPALGPDDPDIDPMPDARHAPLRWALLGCARICRGGLIPGIRASETGLVQSIASRNPETARAWASEFGIPTAHGNYEAAVADPEVDAVYIPLPNELHKPWVLAAADAGKHVLCEKPLALDADEAEAMVEHCRSRGVLLMEAFMWRHQPRTAALRRLIDEGAIGTLRFVRSSFSFAIDLNDWRLEAGRGAGALWDIGTYGVSTCRLYAGEEPKAVRAFQRTSPTGVDLTLSAILDFPSGVIGVIDCSFEAAFRCEYELVGSTGALRVPDAYLPPESPVALRSGIAFETGGTAPPEVLGFPGTNQYACMVDAFARSVADGSLLPPSEDGLSQMRALCAIQSAARSN